MFNILVVIIFFDGFIFTQHGTVIENTNVAVISDIGFCYELSLPLHP